MVNQIVLNKAVIAISVCQSSLGFKNCLSVRLNQSVRIIRAQKFIENEISSSMLVLEAPEIIVCSFLMCSCIFHDVIFVMIS